MLFVLFVLAILWLVGVLLLDADFTTRFFEKFGVDLDTFYKDKVVWITGASTGIGAALAVEASKHGATVVLTARNENLLGQVKKQCMNHGAKDDKVLVLPFDLCEFERHEEAFKSILAKYGKLDVLINNAGRSQRARWEFTAMEVDRALFELNVFSVINLSRVVLPYMLQKGQGCLAVMSSSAGKAGAPFSGSYTGSKHALHGYFESLRNERVGCGVDISMLCPGPTFSNLLQVASTEKPGESFGENMNKGDKRMTAERCAELSLIAIANKIPESWICFFPVLPLMYFNQYLPAVSKSLMHLLGPKFLAKVRDSRNAMESDKYK